MSKITQLLLREMEEKLHDIVTGKDSIREYERAIVIIQRYLVQITESFPSFQDNRHEEIYFYKEIMPRFYGYLIYYVRLYELESSFPAGSGRARKRVLKKELKSIDRYFEQHKKEYRYYKTEDEVFDADLFIRQTTPSMLFLDETVTFSDSQLSTPTGIIFSRFFAYERLQEYINEALKGLTGNAPGPVQKLKLKAKKMALVEIVCGLKSSGVFEDAELKEIAQLFENGVDVDLREIYRMKYDLYARKNPSSFLEFMTKKLREDFPDNNDSDRRHLN